MRRRICVLLALWITLIQPLVVPAGLPFSSAALAQQADTLAPVIELEELTESVADFSQVFSARVVDNQELTEVTLHYRRDGEGPFQRAPMKSIGGTEFYSVSLATEPDDQRNFEYYLQAIDAAGNRTVSGFAFEPYIRNLAAARKATPAPSSITDSSPATDDPTVAKESTTIASLPPETATESRTGNRKWWAIALGVLAVGALASAANSGDNSGADTTPSTPADPVTPSIVFTVPAP